MVDGAAGAYDVDDPGRRGATHRARLQEHAQELLRRHARLNEVFKINKDFSQLFLLIQLAQTCEEFIA